jgi:hypothetical protein
LRRLGKRNPWRQRDLNQHVPPVDQALRRRIPVNKCLAEHRAPRLARTRRGVLGLHLRGAETCLVRLVGRLGRLQLRGGDVLLVPVEHLRPVERRLRGGQLGLRDRQLCFRIGDRVAKFRELLQVKDAAVGLKLLLVGRRPRDHDLDAGLLLQGGIERDNRCPGSIVRNLRGGHVRLLALGFPRCLSPALDKAPDD